MLKSDILNVLVSALTMIVVLVVGLIPLQGQNPNLVPNGSFENFKEGISPNGATFSGRYRSVVPRDFLRNPNPEGHVSNSHGTGRGAATYLFKQFMYMHWEEALLDNFGINATHLQDWKVYFIVNNPIFVFDTIFSDFRFVKTNYFDNPYPIHVGNHFFHRPELRDSLIQVSYYNFIDSIHLRLLPLHYFFSYTPDRAAHGSNYLHYYGHRTIANHPDTLPNSGFFYNEPTLTIKLAQPLKRGRKYRLGCFLYANNEIDTTNLPTEPVVVQSDCNNIPRHHRHYFKEKTGTWRSYLHDNFGAMLTETNPGRIAPGHGNYAYPYETHPPQFRLESPFMGSRDEWKEVSWNFIADKDYEYLTLGNLWSKLKTNYMRWPFKFEVSEGPCSIPDQHRFDIYANQHDGYWYMYWEQDLFLDSVYLFDVSIFEGDTVVCLGDSLTLRDRLGRVVNWHLPDGADLRDSVYRFVVEDSVRIITASYEDIKDTMYVYGQHPRYDLVHTDSLCIYTGNPYNKVAFIPRSEQMEVSWYFKNVVSADSVFLGSDSGLLRYVIQDALGCSDSGSLLLGKYCPEWGALCPFPNAFSPNGDGINDLFKLDCSLVQWQEVMILNRWGEIMVREKGQDFSWDGTVGGMACPPGVYTVYIRYKTYLEPHITHEYRGTVSLLR